jgi:N-acetylmuramoyl-L-alanine amidase
MSKKARLVVLAIIGFVLVVPGTASAYTIQPGDTLSELAQLFRVELDDLLKLNPEISNPDRIYAGQSLKLPKFYSYHFFNDYDPYSTAYDYNKDSNANARSYLSTYQLKSGETKESENGTDQISPMDKFWLARIVHAEAKGEPFAGKVAVVHVILNRVRHEAFPDTIREVIFQQGQFQPVSNGSIYQPPDEESIRAVEYALKTYDERDQDILYFYNPQIATSSWIFSRPTVKVIGNHVFAR